VLGDQEAQMEEDLFDTYFLLLILYGSKFTTAECAWEPTGAGGGGFVRLTFIVL